MKFNKLTAIIMAISLLALASAFILPPAYTNAVNTVNSVKLSVDSTLTDTVRVTYTCPMHPEVTSDQPGTCPKCGMDLIKKENKDEGMNSCPDMEKCKEKGCNMNDCKGQSGGCMNNCPVMKEHKDQQKHDHDSKDKDDGNGHKHKSGCSKKRLLAVCNSGNDLQVKRIEV